MRSLAFAICEQTIAVPEESTKYSPRVKVPVDITFPLCEYSRTVTDIKQRVRAKLKRHKRNQEWLAAQLGISRSYLSMILSGQRRPSLPLAVKLEEMTGVKMREFAEVA